MTLPIRRSVKNHFLQAEVFIYNCLRRWVCNEFNKCLVCLWRGVGHVKTKAVAVTIFRVVPYE